MNWRRQQKRAPLKPDWTAIDQRIAERFSGLDCGGLAGTDQLQMMIRDFLKMSAVDLTDQRDAFCVLTGLIMLDTLAANVLERDEAIPTRFLVDICADALTPAARGDKVLL